MPSHHFSDTYAAARNQFLAAAAQSGARIESHVLPSHRGLLGEELATDVARLGADDARRLLILSSGTHGPEGFCGSGCQVALLRDDDWLERINRSGVAVLLVHAVNPYGFSHLQRTNEDNVDPNRNCLPFDEPLRANTRYAELHPLLLPQTWPPGTQNEQAIAAYISTHGMAAFRETMTTGQAEFPDGLFFSGTEPIWSNRVMRAILHQHASHATDIGWIDIHTGLGPKGHGEKIYAGRHDSREIDRTRAWWGPDVFCPFTGESVSADIRGPLGRLLYDEAPTARVALMALEFGTLASADVQQSLRASAWARRLGEGALADAQRAAIRIQVRDAFYCDDDVWKGMVLGQTRTAALQALTSLQAAPL